MFAVYSRTKVIVRMLLIAVIFFNTLTSSTVFAQKNTESISVTSPNIQNKEQGSLTPSIEDLSDTIVKVAESQQAASAESKSSTVFIENVGQFDPRARFQAQGSGATIYFSDDAIWFTLLELSSTQFIYQ